MSGLQFQPFGMIEIVVVPLADDIRRRGLNAEIAQLPKIEPPIRLQDHNVRPPEGVDVAAELLTYIPGPPVWVDHHDELFVAVGLATKVADTALREGRSEEHTSELQSPDHLVCRLLLEKKKNY